MKVVVCERCKQRFHLYEGDDLHVCSQCLERREKQAEKRAAEKKKGRR